MCTLWSEGDEVRREKEEALFYSRIPNIIGERNEMEKSPFSIIIILID